MCRLAFILLLPFLVSGQPFTEKDIAFLGKKSAGAFQPSDRGSALKAWYKSDAGVFEDAGTDPAEDGDTIRQWNDQSGNNLHIGQEVAANKPLYQTEIENSLPGVQFVSTDFFTNAGLPVAAAPFTIYMVARSSDAVNLQYPLVLVTLDSSTVGFYFGWYGAGVGDPIIWQAIDTGGSSAITTTGYSANVTAIGTAQEASTTSRSVWINGGSVGSNTDSRSPTLGVPQFSVGAERITDPFTGYIFEIVIVNTADNEAARAQMETYLSTKWGL